MGNKCKPYRGRATIIKCEDVEEAKKYLEDNGVTWDDTDVTELGSCYFIVDMHTVAIWYCLHKKLYILNPDYKKEVMA